MKQRLPFQPGLTGFVLLIAIACWLPGANAQNAVPGVTYMPPDSIFYNATIVTLDEHQVNPDPGSIAEALAIRDGVIIAIGTDEDILALAGPATKRVNLHGRTMMPGFVESHVHPMGAAESFAREKYKLRNTPEGYAIKLSVKASSDETMAMVAEAMQLLLDHRTPAPDEWINVQLLHDPEVGFGSVADVSLLMSTPRLADVKISKSDLTEIVPNYPFVLSVHTTILSAPEEDVWYHITADSDGGPVHERVVEFNF